MHETLRTSFKLQKKSAIWQSITSDFMYGTFFNLYAKFEYEKDNYRPIKCTIKIQNFQGDATIGLSKIDPEIKVCYDITLKEYVYLIRIHLKGFFPKTELTQKVSFIEENNLCFDTKAAPVTEFSNKNLLFVELIYDPLHSNEELDDINKLPYIDSLRYLRDGDQLLKKEYSIYGAGPKVIIDSDNPNPKLGKHIDKNNVTHDYNFTESKPCRNTYVQFF